MDQKKSLRNFGHCVQGSILSHEYKSYHFSTPRIYYVCLVILEEMAINSLKSINNRLVSVMALK